MRARLTVLSGPFAGQTIEIPHGKLVIGREVDCHLRPDSALVSHHHCVLLLDDYTLRVRDLGSRNGTFVNSRRIASGDTILLTEDTVSVGDMTCQVEVLSDEADGHPADSVTHAVSPQALEGTIIIEGDTVQSDAADLRSPPTAPLAREPHVSGGVPSQPEVG